MHVGEHLDPADLVPQRWFASPPNPITAIVVEERFDFAGGGAIAILRVDIEGGPPRWRSMPIESADGLSPWVEAMQLAVDGGEIAGERGSRLVGRPPMRPIALPGSSVTPLGRDQSHTSVVVDNAVIVKLYRALSPGTNPEPELNSDLDELGGASIPSFRGSLAMLLAGADVPMDVAFLHDLVPDADDAFEALADRLAAWLRAGAPIRALASLTEDAQPIGRAVADLHASLARLRGPSRGPRPSEPADLDAWQRAGRAAHRAAISALGAADPHGARWLIARGEALDRALADLRPTGTLQRIHADLHLGQLLRSGDRILFGDLEGDPLRPIEERRRLDTPLRDLASMLRSFDHVARSGMRRSGAPLDEIVAGTSAVDPAIEAWLRAVREQFLGAYEAEAAARRLKVEIEPALLRALEVEKELSEFAYAATYLPAWMYAPSAGMRWLLDR